MGHSWRHQLGRPSPRSEGTPELSPSHICLPCVYLPLITIAAKGKKKSRGRGKTERITFCIMQDDAGRMEGWRKGGAGALHRAGWARWASENTKQNQLKLPPCVRKDMSLFACSVDEFWGAGCSLVTSSFLSPSLRGAGWVSPQNPSPRGITNAGKPRLSCHTTRNWGASGPTLLQRRWSQCHQVCAVLVQLSRDQTHFSSSSFFPRCFHQFSVGRTQCWACQGGPHAGRVPSLPLSSRRVL